MHFLIYIHIIVTFLLALVILVQKSEGGASLFSSSASLNGAMTARGAEDFLTKCTWVLASLFIGICLILGTITKAKYNKQNDISAIMQQDYVADSHGKQYDTQAGLDSGRGDLVPLRHDDETLDIEGIDR